MSTWFEPRGRDWWDVSGECTKRAGSSASSELWWTTRERENRGGRKSKRKREREREREWEGWSARATAMGEAACSPSCAGRLCGRQPCATVLVVQEVHHHRHQRLRRHLPPKKQRLLPTLTWQMSVTPATKPEIQGPAEKDRCRSSRRRQQERAPRSSVTSPEGDRPTPQATPGSTFTSVEAKRTLLLLSHFWYTILLLPRCFWSRP